MRFLPIAIGILATVVVVVATPPAAAESVSIAPLEYSSSLRANEVKKGYVYVDNPSEASITYHLKVKAFRQIDDQGRLEFYSDGTIAKGIRLDLEDISLGPHEGAKIYFLLDAKSLPSGDVFAAILVGTGKLDTRFTSLPEARVGTLLYIENGTPPTHHATVNDIHADWFQVGNQITMQATVKNTSNNGSGSLGFRPDITFEITPYGAHQVRGPLIFNNRERVVTYVDHGDYFGPVLLRAKVDGHESTKLIFAVVGYWRWLVPLIVVLLGLIVTGWINRRKLWEVLAE